MRVLIAEFRCIGKIDYVAYPRRGYKAERRGQCSRRTIRRCGRCKVHCEKAPVHACGVDIRVVK